MKHKELGSGDKVEHCDYCGRKFRPDTEVHMSREFNSITHIRCAIPFFKQCGGLLFDKNGNEVKYKYGQKSRKRTKNS
jgi:hypothetical protein